MSSPREELINKIKSLPLRAIPHLKLPEDTPSHLIRGFIAEALGMFVWIFLACGSVPAVEATLGSLSILPESLFVISISFGIGISIAIYLVGDVSGAHLNPIVSTSLIFLRRVSVLKGIIWMCAQFTGSVIAAGCLRLFVTNAQEAVSALGATHISKSISWIQGYYVESVLSTILVFCAIGVAVRPYGRTVTPLAEHNNVGARSNAGIAIGFLIWALNVVGIPLTGASMNPARSFGPALVSWDWNHQLIYWLGPFTGCLCGTLLSILFIARPEGRLPQDKARDRHAYEM